MLLMYINCFSNSVIISKISVYTYFIRLYTLGLFIQARNNFLVLDLKILIIFVMLITNIILIRLINATIIMLNLAIIIFITILIALF